MTLCVRVGCVYRVSHGPVLRAGRIHPKTTIPLIIFRRIYNIECGLGTIFSVKLGGTVKIGDTIPNCCQTLCQTMANWFETLTPKPSLLTKGPFCTGQVPQSQSGPSRQPMRVCRQRAPTHYWSSEFFIMWPCEVMNVLVGCKPFADSNIFCMHSGISLIVLLAAICMTVWAYRLFCLRQDLLR